MWQQPGGWGQQQWPIQQSAYANMAHDQVDWAALAKQWMQFKDVGESTNLAAAPPPPPPPIDIGQQAGSNEQAPAGNTWSGMPYNGVVSDNQAWDNAASSDWTSEMDIEGAEKTSNPTNANSTNAQAFDYNHGVVSRGIFENAYGSVQPSKDNSGGGLGQFNQGYEYNQQNYHQQQQQQYWMQQSQGYGEGGQFGGQHANYNKHHQQGNHRPHFQDDDVTGPTQLNAMDAAKRKTLPAWIREGLEKMEKEKAKKEEQDRLAKEKEDKKVEDEAKRKEAEEEAARTGVPVKSKFEDDEGSDLSDDGRSGRKESPVRQKPVSRSPSPEDKYMTPEERQQHLMMKVKAMLTDVLLSVTNEEIGSICKSVYAKCKKRELAAPAKMIGKSNALASLKSSFGGYDSEISDNSDDDDDTNNENGEASSDDEDSDVADRRRYEFSRKQRDRLKQVELEEKQAMDWFNMPTRSKERLHSASKNTSIPGLDIEQSPDNRSEPATHSAERRRSSSSNQRRHSDANADERLKEDDDKQSEKSESVIEAVDGKGGSRTHSREHKTDDKKRRDSRHKDHSSSRDRQRRSRSRDRKHKDRSRSRDRKHKDRSGSRDRKRKDRSRSRDRKRKDRSGSRDRKRTEHGRRSRSKESRKGHKYESGDRKRHRSRSKERRCSKRSRSRSKERRASRRSISAERSSHRSRSRESSRRSRTPTRSSKSHKHDKSKERRSSRRERNDSYSDDKRRSGKRSKRDKRSKSKEDSNERQRRRSSSPTHDRKSSSSKHRKLSPRASTKSSDPHKPKTSESSSSSSSSSSESETESPNTE